MQLTDEGAARALAVALDIPRVIWMSEVESTMDVAHALAAEGAPAGTLVVADTQTRGRGRGGKTWSSPAGAGLWMTLLERPIDATGLDVLSLRAGLRVAHVLDRFAIVQVQLKWPNDLMLPEGKLGGILVEVRWREQRPEWVAIGIGINLVPSDDARRASLEPCDRMVLLSELVPSVRAAANARGTLSVGEQADFARRDWARGRRASAPRVGTVVGISPAGAVLIETPEGTASCASGSLVLEGESP